MDTTDISLQAPGVTMLSSRQNPPLLGCKLPQSMTERDFNYINCAPYPQKMIEQNKEILSEIKNLGCGNAFNNYIKQLSSFVNNLTPA